ncbi:MAG: mevalonate kinase [Candidatus Peregrinibacteria bacterium Greene0416_19]|nr:MAG: mevalonate kinase [Candidatus Peregrinibacteria bacterium Greene0416_19]
MSTRQASACGKIILSGEYAVVFGYPGIAIPSQHQLTAMWEPGTGPLTIEWDELSANPEWESYLRQIVLLCGNPTGRLTIDNSIPLQRGMGSSTALVVAVTRAILGDDARERALAIEDEVNPGHSGLDFAVICENQPLAFRKGLPPQPAAIDLSFLNHATLIDTGKPDQTTPELVTWVKERERDLKDAFVLIGQCTEALLVGEHPMTVFPDHHRAQLALGVVPDHVHELILEIEHAGGAAKVIGAGGKTGGGGMVIAIHAHSEQVQSIAHRRTLGIWKAK